MKAPLTTEQKLRRQFRLIDALQVFQIVAAMAFGAIVGIAYAAGWLFELTGGWR